METKSLIENNDELTGDSHSLRQVKRLKQRDIDKNLSYKLYFLAAAAKGLVKRQNIIIDKSKIYNVPFEIKSEEYKAWDDVFSSGNDQIQYGLHLKSATTMFMKIIVDLNINYRNILHLRNELTDFNPEILFTKGSYRNSATVEDVITTGKNKVIIGIRSVVLNSNDNKMIESKDYFMVLNVNQRTMDNINSQQDSKNINYKSWLEPPIMIEEDIIDSDNIYVPKKMGSNYGWVSGDLNFVHTTNFLAKLFGYKRAFVQGLCTAHYVLANLPDNMRPTNFNINFMKPVYTDSHITIKYSKDAYKVIDSSEMVLAHGTLN